MNATIVLDIGKTNVKLLLLDDGGKTLAEQRRPNAIITDGPYPHHDTDGIWDWMLDTMRGFSALANIVAIVPVTHGATAALVDDDGLVLPVLDYEFTMPSDFDPQYRALRPPFAETCSPELPAGLNLGHQLAWLAHAFPEQFSRARHILMYPQYWTWRLSGVAAGEATSLGCHTDLWQAVQQRYSSLIERKGWHHLLPPIQPAWARLGTVRPELIERTGLPSHCQVICGIHDSNASLLRYLARDKAKAPDAAPQPSVLSTGTWLIAASFDTPLSRLVEQADMLANTNALGQPVACMRFMGGREFAALAGEQPVPCTQADLAQLIAQQTLALPCFSDAGGPFSGHAGTIIGPAPANAAQSYALATLYCVLMSDYCLDALGATGPVVVEGSFTGNLYFAPLLAALRGQSVAVSDDTSGTAYGGWLLQHWGRAPELQAAPAAPLDLPGWREYRTAWLHAVSCGAPARP